MGLIIEPRQGNEHHTINAHQWKSLICIWVLFATTCVVMVLRLVSQFGIMRIVRADDILMIIAWVCTALKVDHSCFSILHIKRQHMLNSSDILIDPASSENHRIHCFRVLWSWSTQFTALRSRRLCQIGEVRDVFCNSWLVERFVWQSSVRSVSPLLYTTSFAASYVHDMDHHCRAGCCQHLLPYFQFRQMRSVELRCKRDVRAWVVLVVRKNDGGAICPRR